MEQFWQQNRLALSVELFGILVAAFMVVTLAIAVSRRLQGPTSRLETSRPGNRTTLTFRAARILLSVIGIATLVATLLPGLMPFKGHANPNLEMGGMALFFLWPLIIVQVIVGFLPLETKLTPPQAWGLLVICYIIGLSVCKTAIGLLYR